jgi:hypothetical protein
MKQFKNQLFIAIEINNSLLSGKIFSIHISLRFLTSFEMTINELCEAVSNVNLSSGEFNIWKQSQIGIRIKRGCLGLLRQPLYAYK